PDESASGGSPLPDWQPSGSFRTVERATTGVAPAVGEPSSESPGASSSPAAPAQAPLSSAPALSPRAWGGIAALWLVLAVFWTNQMVLYTASARPNDDYSWIELARLQVATSVIWLALSP